MTLDGSRIRPVLLALAVIFIAAGAHVSAAAGSAPPVPDARALRNLHAFVKLYGYVRWFHPSDEASAIDWDRFGALGARRVRGANDDDALRGALEYLFTPLAPSLQLYGRGERARDVAAVFADAPPDAPVVAWQHLGVGAGNPRSAYRSVRLHRGGAGDTSPSRFGTILQSVDAAPLRGKTVRLRSALRARVAAGQGSACMWLRVDRIDGKMGFFDNMNDRPVTSPEWTEAVITGMVDGDAGHVVFGAFLQGSGSCDVDDFHLEVKGDGNRWGAMAIENPGFEAGQAEAPTGWMPPMTGYLSFAVTESPREGHRCLRISDGRLEGVAENALFRTAPARGESFDRELVPGLRCRLPLALPSLEGHTVPTAGASRLDALQREIATLPDTSLTADSEGTRIAGIAYLWNVTQHFWPYFDLVRVDWERTLDAALARAMRDRTSEEYGNTLRAMLAPLQDGHVSVRPVRRVVRAWLPVNFGWIENQIVVIDSADSLLHPGDVVRSIDGRDARKLADSLMALRSGTDRYRGWQVVRVFDRGAPGSIAKLALDRDHRMIQVEVPRDTAPAFPPPRFEAITRLEDGIWYVDLGRARMTQIDSMITDLAKARGIIFDARGYPNGTHDVLAHLSSQPLQSAIWRIPRIVRPDHEGPAEWDERGRWSLPPRLPRFEGRAVFLIGPGAISYAESVLGIVEHYRLGELVGEPTAGTNGNVNEFLVPGGFTARWTGMRVVKHDGSQHHLIGIRPTVPVQPTVSGVRAGRDEVLEKGLELARGGR